MKPFPHHYRVVASAEPLGEVMLASAGVPDLPTQPPVDFDGPGDRWSPETLLVGAIADCFVLTFRAIARASKLSWLELQCSVDGVLEREQGKTRFTAFTVHAHLLIPAGSDAAAAEQALHKAEHGCLISNSLSAERTLHAVVEIVDTAAAAENLTAV